jgi:hypothetical protein
LPISLDADQAHITLRFTVAANLAFVGWVKRHYEEMNAGPPHLRGPWLKLVAHVARFALILHLASRAAGETTESDVGEDSVLSALVIGEYFKSHSRKAYRFLRSDVKERRIAQVVEWIGAREGRRCTARDIYSAHVAGCKNKNAAMEMLKLLEEYGWGRICESKPASGGRTTISFTLNERGA